MSEVTVPDGAVALVCGATGPVGSAICRVLAARGRRVAVHCRSRRDRAERLVGELPGPGPHAVVAGDLSRSAKAAEVIETATRELGAAPAIVVNAAYPPQPSRLVRDITDADLEAHLDGFRAHVNVCRYAVDGMRAAGWGRIVLISGALAARSFPALSLFSAVKAGLDAFSRTLALEAGADGVTVNVVAPGRVEQPGGEAAFEPDPAYEALDRVVRLRTALPHMVTPGEIGEVVAFLVSDATAAVTGQTIYLAAGEPM